MLKAGRLRHRITIESPVDTQDAVTGEITRGWATFLADVPASIEPVSVREFFAARQIQAEVSVMIVIRFVPGLTPSMRLRDGAVIYNPIGMLADKVSGQEYITIPCTQGVNEG